MRRVAAVAGVLVVLSSPAGAPHAAPPPKPPGLEEKVQVTLVQVDALVVDAAGKTVPGLTKADFAMKIGGRDVKVDTVDLVCPIGGAADPAPLKRGEPLPAPLGAGIKRRIVLAFDYTFLETTMRGQILDAAAAVLRAVKPPEEEVMIVALTDEVRVEQKFTTDVRLLVGALARMKHDATLAFRDYPLGVSGRTYFENITTLMDVLGSYDGSKGVVFFSQAGIVGSAMQDLYYNEVGAHAAAARGVIYPAKPNLLDAGGQSDALVRLANTTGGRMQFFGNDLSVPYRRAQRDLLCRYTIGAYVDPSETRDPQTLTVSLLNKPGLSIRAPEQMQIFSEDAKQAARIGAAYVDPAPFERPVVRAFGFSATPAGRDSWDTILAVSWPSSFKGPGADVDVKAAVRRDNKTVGEYARRIHVEAPAGGAATRPVTILGDTKLASGSYDLDVVLTDASGGEIVAATTDFVVPMVVPDALILRGPVMGKVVPGGQFLRADPKDDPEKTRLGKTLGAGNGFEPLFVQEIDPGDKLLFYWSACVYKGETVPGDLRVSRTFFDATGEVVRALDPLPLELESRGKGVACQDMLENVTGGTLKTGDYRLDVTVTHANGDVVTRGTTPLNVR
ncbi:MAG TPA: VWA domain-containing protein [Candidatus Polarisedimenticolaceae bacterium]|nr:VWA domain-containing protein [Candidatus Polarisedimenticolaceae bacterium]